MARIRSIKPGFFTNEHLAELSAWHRLCFAGLWTLADREGRLEDRPRRIKAALFPYDELDVDALLDGLAAKAFVVRYVADGAAYLAIPTFLEHQRPKQDELASRIPAPRLEHPRGISRDRVRIKDIRESYKGQRDPASGADGAPPPADGASALEVPADGADRRRAEDFQELWNQCTSPPIAKCRELTSKRRRHIKARLTERTPDIWREVFTRIQQSSFCRGESGDRNWRASFDWVIGSPDVAVKVLEGKYDDRVKSFPKPERSGCRHQPKCRDAAMCYQRTKLEDAVKGGQVSMEEAASLLAKWQAEAS